MSHTLLSEEVRERWDKVITAEGVAPIRSNTVKNNTIRVLETTRKELSEATNTTTSGVSAGGAGSYDPVLISMVRRVMPSLIANDIVGVQPMSGPTGLIFAMHVNSTSAAGVAATDIFNAAPDPTLSGVDAAAAQLTTATGEGLGVGQQVNAATGTATEPVTQSAPWAEVDFSISKVSVTARTRALKARYTEELAQDLKAIHGMDAEAELTNILSGEVIGEMNRELVNTVRSQAVKSVASAWGGLTANTYRVITDSDGRWEAENYKSLYMAIVREANAIAQTTRRGLGNIIICSANVAAGLEGVVKLDNGGIPGTNLDASDFLGTTYAGVLGGRFKLFIDPYQTVDFVTIGYKGANEYDSGVFFCPYVPLQLMKAKGEEDFQPRLGMKSRYALATNPMVTGVAGANSFYRDFLVTFN